MSHHDFDKKNTAGNRQGLNTDRGVNSFSPLIIGAVVAMVALVAFLMFSGPSDNQQAGFNTNPPATTTAPADRSPSVIPNTPPASAPQAPPPAK